jgi:hypothetical protein
VTTVPAAKAALVTILTAALPATQVIYGPGSSVTVTTPRILVVGSAQPDSPSVTGVVTPTTVDGLHGTEVYDITVEESVTIIGTFSQGAESDALADVATAIATVQANPALAGAGTHASVDGGFDLSEADNELGRAVVVRFSVHVQAAF